MSDDVLSLLHKQMDTEKVHVAEALVQGSATDFADYRHMCGVIKGLELSQRVLADMQERLRRQEE
jgi:hypothetical protein